MKKMNYAELLDSIISTLFSEINWETLIKEMAIQCQKPKDFPLSDDVWERLLWQSLRLQLTELELDIYHKYMDMKEDDKG